MKVKYDSRSVSHSWLPKNSSSIIINRHRLKTISLIIIIVLTASFRADCSEKVLQLKADKDRYDLTPHLTRHKFADLNIEENTPVAEKQSAHTPLRNHKWFSFSLRKAHPPADNKLWCLDSGTNQMSKMKLYPAVA